MRQRFSLIVPLMLGTMLVWSGSTAAQVAKGADTAETAKGVAAATLHVPDHPIWVGSVRLPVQVLADDKPLGAGRYRIRLTGTHAEDNAVGQTAALERWVEFVQNGQVKGRAMAPVVPAGAAHEVAEGSVPARGTVRVERLKSDAYYRVWFNYQGDQILVYLPIA